MEPLQNPISPDLVIEKYATTHYEPAPGTTGHRGDTQKVCFVGVLFWADTTGYEASQMTPEAWVAYRYGLTETQVRSMEAGFDDSFDTTYDMDLATYCRYQEGRAIRARYSACERDHIRYRVWGYQIGKAVRAWKAASELVVEEATQALNEHIEQKEPVAQT